MFNIRLIAYLAVIAGLFAAGWAVNGWRWSAKYEALVADHQTKVAQAESAAREATEALRKREQENAKRLQDAETKRQADLRKQDRVAAGLRTERDSLRNSITAYAEAYGAAGDSEAAARDRAVALGNLLQEALQSSEESAIDGERCEGNVRSLLESWPK